MNKITLETASISGLKIESNICDLHHDIAQYIRYIKNRSVKRSSRNNYLLKGDVVRLSKLMPGHELDTADFDTEDFHYPGFIDSLAYAMGFVEFDIVSNYYDSTFPENYITIKENNYQKHIHLPLQKQEERILSLFNTEGSEDRNEFICQSPLGILDHFQSYNIGEVVKTIDFVKVRLFLFDILSNLEVNTWYSVKSLIEYLKSNHPYFLIPRQPEVIKTKSYRQKELFENRYAGFSDTYEQKRYQLDTTYKDIFERVEGRYIERFLEFIPFLLGYTELAYNNDDLEKYRPTIGRLGAFRITPRFFNLINKNIQEPKIVVQPNFEISIESDIYPVSIILQLESIGHLIKKDVLSQVKLDKNKVIQKVANEPEFDPIQYLSSINSLTLPENVKTELKEWCIYADAFILYENVGILESSFKFPNTEQFIVQKINKKFDIIKNPIKLIEELESNQTIPIKKITHKNDKFLELNGEYKSIFSNNKALNKKKLNNLEKLKINRLNLIKLVFATEKGFSLLSNQLLEKGCMINTSDTEKAIIIDQKDEKILKETLKDISQKYKLELENK
jgi:hypothetical protein